MSKGLYCSFFLFMVILTGCATVVETPVEIGPSQTDAFAEKSGESELNSSIPVDLLYVLLSAEIAGQKGAFDIALDNYLKAAEWSKSPKVAERATQIALFNKDEERALEATELWLQRDPESVMAARIAVMLNVKLSDYDQAVSHLELLRSLSEEEFGKTIMEIVKHMETKANTSFAMEFMERLKKVFPGQPDIYYANALLAMKNRELERANQEVTKAIEGRPDWNQALILRARIIAQQGNPESAVSTLRELVISQPDDKKLRMFFAKFLVTLNKYPEAERQFNEIIRKDPEHHDAIYSLARVKMQQKDIQGARSLLLKLVDATRWQDQAYFYLGRIEAKEKNNDKAIAWFEKIIRGPLIFDAQASIVSILAGADKTDQAIKKSRILQQRFPSQSYRFYLIEAELLNQQSDYQGAFEVLTRALKLTPDQPELLYTRALVAENLDRLDVLEQDLLRVLKNDPDDPNALNALGYTLADRTRRYAEAKRYLDRAIELQPDDPVIIDSYGWLQYRLGNLNEALDYLQRAYDLNKDPEITSHLGEVLWVSGKLNEARALLKTGLDKHPDSEHLLKMKQHFPAAFSE